MEVYRVYNYVLYISFVKEHTDLQKTKNFRPKTFNGTFFLLLSKKRYPEVLERSLETTFHTVD